MAKPSEKSDFMSEQDTNLKIKIPKSVKIEGVSKDKTVSPRMYIVWKYEKRLRRLV